MTIVARAAREVFRRERIPARIRWWFVAEGMGEWYALLAKELEPALGPRSRDVLATLSAPMFTRRYGILRSAVPSLPDPSSAPRAIGIVFGALYRVASNPGSAWVFDPLGGAPSTFRDHLEAERLIAGISPEARWLELTNHLGELLIRLTDDLPAMMSRSRGVLGEICFAAGVRYGKKMKKTFGLAGRPHEALEVLRMAEYVFRVNPQHWQASDHERGFLEGTACPWYTASGWNGAHCGIFGQFQSGIAAVFGLGYHLTTTIPKHGGHTCRIDVTPRVIPLGKKRQNAEAT